VLIIHASKASIGSFTPDETPYGAVRGRTSPQLNATRRPTAQHPV